MAASDIEICNRALDMVGADPIMSFADAAKAAKLCQRNYAPVRDATLRAYPWNCAIRRAVLPAATAPLWGFANAFELPQGPGEPSPYCLRLLRLEGELDTDIVYRVEGRRILTDEAAPLRVVYIARVLDPTQYDPLLDDAIAARLAVDLCIPLTQNGANMAALGDTYKAKLAEARRSDAQEGSAEQVAADQWLGSRR